MPTPPVPEGAGQRSLNALPKAEVPTFEGVYERYFDFVWSMTRRLGVDPGAMDDVVQEVFLVIHAKLHTLQHPEALRSWIYGIVRRTASDHRRKQRSAPHVDPITPQAPFEDTTVRSPADLAEHSDDVRRLWSLLDTLDATKREVFIMAELEELTCPEIAAALQIPLNTAYSRLRAAREAFEAALARADARQRGKASP